MLGCIDSAMEGGGPGLPPRLGKEGEISQDKIPEWGMDGSRLGYYCYSEFMVGFWQRFFPFYLRLIKVKLPVTTKFGYY